MRPVVILLLSTLVVGTEAVAQQAKPKQHPATLLGLMEGGRSHRIGLQVTVDNLPYDQYWAKTFDAIFEFADGNSDNELTEDELRLVPSSRAVRLSLGSAFAPPVASIQSLITPTGI